MKLRSLFAADDLCPLRDWVWIVPPIEGKDKKPIWGSNKSMLKVCVMVREQIGGE